MSEESYNAKMLRLASNGEANELKDHLELDTEEKDMNYVDPQTKYTVLTNAIQARNNDCIRILLQNGADPNFVMRVNDDSQYTALIIAFFLNDDANDDEPLKLLLDGGADPNIECLMDGDYTTLLTACIESLNFKFIHTLVKGGADVKKELFNDKALLMYCYITEAGEEPEKSAEMMQILISYGAPIEHKKLLAYAANFENVPCMQVLLDAGYPINKQMDHGTTALNLASEFGKESAVKFLLSKGADPNIMDMDGDSCVNTAALRNNKEIVRMLIDAGADCKHWNNKGETGSDTTTDLEIKEMMLAAAEKANPSSKTSSNPINNQIEQGQVLRKTRRESHKEVQEATTVAPSRRRSMQRFGGGSPPSSAGPEPQGCCVIA